MVLLRSHRAAGFSPAPLCTERTLAPLSEHLRLGAAYLEKRGVTHEAFNAAGGEIVLDARRLDPIFPREPAIVFRFHDPLTGDPLIFTDQNGEAQPFIRIRRLSDAEPKFLQPRSSGTHVYFAPLRRWTWRHILADCDLPLVISEGETRALAGAVHDIPVIALTGVDCGQRDGTLHPDLEQVSWQGRIVYLAFDSDVSRKQGPQRALHRLAGLLAERGAHVFQVMIPPAPDGSKQGLDDYLARHGRDSFIALTRSPETALMSSTEQYEPPLPLAELIATEYPPTEWVWEGIVLKGEVNLLYGDGGIGKSLLALYIGVAAAAGRRLFGSGTMPMPVIGLFAEDAAPQVRQRVGQALIELGLDHKGDLPMRLWCQPRGETTLAQIDDNGVVKELPRLRMLRDELAALGRPALVILDSLADMFAFDENKRQPVNAALKQVLGSLCRENGATVLVLAHPSKASMVDGTHYSGSTAFNNGVRQRLTLEVPKREPGDLREGPPPRLLKVAKSNYGAPLEKLLYFYGASITELPAKPAMAPGEARDLVLRVIVGLIDKRINVVNRNGAVGDGRTLNDLAKTIRDQCGVTIGSGEVRDHLRQLVDAGVLHYRESNKSVRPHVKAGFERGPKCRL